MYASVCFTVGNRTDGRCKQNRSNDVTIENEGSHDLNQALCAYVQLPWKDSDDLVSDVRSRLRHGVASEDTVVQ